LNFPKDRRSESPILAFTGIGLLGRMSPSLHALLRHFKPEQFAAKTPLTSRMIFPSSKEPVVKKPILLAACVALLLGLTYYLGTTHSTSARAQVRPSNIDRGVAVVDLKYIFDNYPRFKYLKEQMDDKVKRAEANVKGYKLQLEKKIKLRDEFPRGSARHDEIDSIVTKMRIELASLFTEQKKKFIRLEASIYFTAYKEIVQQVAKYAGDCGYSIVFRFNSAMLRDDHDVRKVAKHLNKPVVWHRPNSRHLYDPSNRDITKAVLNILKDRTTVRQNQVRGGVPTRTR